MSGQLASFEQQTARKGEVRGGGDLDVARVARHQQHRAPGLLGQRGLVGAFGALRAQLEDARQDVTPEALRRLRQEDRLAGPASASRPGTDLGRTAGSGSPNSVPTHDVSVTSASFTVSRAGSAAIAAPAAAAASITRSMVARSTNGRAAS